MAGASPAVGAAWAALLRTAIDASHRQVGPARTAEVLASLSMALTREDFPELPAGPPLATIFDSGSFAERSRWADLSEGEDG
jgi:hypothetical protein